MLLKPFQMGPETDPVAIRKIGASQELVNNTQHALRDSRVGMQTGDDESDERQAASGLTPELSAPHAGAMTGHFIVHGCAPTSC